jgi:hypothetical protein
MWNWLVSKFSKLFSSSKEEQELPNVVASQQLPVTKTETPMPKVNAPAKTKVENLSDLGVDIVASRERTARKLSNKRKSNSCLSSDSYSSSSSSSSCD